MAAIRTVLGVLARFVIVWILDTLSLLVTSWFVPGLTISAVGDYPTWIVAAGAAFVLGLVNLFVRPLILLLAVPLGFIVVFVVGFLVNAVMLMLTANLMQGAMQLNGWLSAIIAGIVLAAVNGILAAVLNIEDHGSFYEGVIERRLRKEQGSRLEDPGQGIIMLEIDGLSYHHIHRAIQDGYMPHVKEMIEKGGYVLSHTDCGLPSQTSACQTGILFGDNFDIPAFRWYDKSRQKLFVSGNDAAEINARYANGNGLLRGGASVNNMMNGDATLSLLTASDLRGGTDEQKRARARDVYLLLLNPNFFMRVIGLFLGEAALEVWQYFRDRIAGVEPRLNRLHKAYPFVRAATTVFMREVSGFLTLMQIVRGEPAVYTTWPGYDEVAHHSGPWSKYAFGTLRGYDRFIGIVREVIATKAPRPYELLLLSDHGQSFGPTFLMRYGYTLKEFIEQQMPHGTVVVQTSGGDDGMLSVNSMAAELGNVQQQNVGGSVGQAAARQMRRAAEGAAKRQDGELEADLATADVTFCGSGNLAQIYFHAFPERATLSQLNAAYHGMVDAVVDHEGVGLVVVADDDCVPIVFGKNGARNLHTGQVTGEDPLAAYGDVEVRAWQVRRIADFPSAGDMIAISTLYPDGTVAAMEELIGNHGGLGGEQTDSFLLHPADFAVPPTRNSTDLFAVLNARRGLEPQPKLAAESTRARDDWAISNLLAGLGKVSVWAGLAIRSLVFDRSAYRAIADDGLMTGPALLISFSSLLVGALMDTRSTGAGVSRFGVEAVVGFLAWLLAVAVLHATARVLRGTASFTQTFRVMGFIQAAHFLELLRPLPVLGALGLVASTLITIFGAWMAVSVAHRLRGFRSLLLPLLYLIILALGAVAVVSLFGGFGVAVQTVLQRFGLVP